MFCPKCGSQMPDDAVFCMKCGTDFSSYSAQRPAQRPEPKPAPQPAPRPVSTPAPKEKKKKLGVGSIIVLCLFGAGILAMLIFAAITIAQDMSTPDEIVVGDEDVLSVRKVYRQSSFEAQSTLTLYIRSGTIHRVDASIKVSSLALESDMEQAWLAYAQTIAEEEHQITFDINRSRDLTLEFSAADLDLPEHRDEMMFTADFFGFPAGSNALYDTDVEQFLLDAGYELAVEY